MDNEVADSEFATFLSGVVEGKYHNFRRPVLALKQKWRHGLWLIK